MSSVITLTTDFGLSDAYVGSVKGVILSINPEANIVDICHTIQPQNVLQAAFVFSTTYSYFPKDTIHLIIVDPGVGSERKALLLKTNSAVFIAPDNGVLSYVVNDLSPAPPRSSTSELQDITLKPGIEAFAITNPRFWRHPVSPTFHGRDIFAPVAAHLSSGIHPSEFGERLSSVKAFPIPRPTPDAWGNLIGSVLHIDHFGNVVTNIKRNDINRQAIIKIGKEQISGLSDFYAQKEDLMALIGSHGYLEIALKDGNASSFLGVTVGDRVTVSRSRK